MGNIKQYKVRFEEFLSGNNGQRFFNFAYSIGAAIVIWGALFKILHLPGGNLLLAIGMGTEVLMFILTAFDRPPRQYNWEQVFPALGNDRNVEASPEISVTDLDATSSADAIKGSSPIGNISINVVGNPGNVPGAENVAMNTNNPSISGEINSGTIAVPAVGYQTEALQLPDLSPMSDISENYVNEMDKVIQELSHLRETTNALNTLYELQLRSISSQLNAIETSGKDISNMRDMMERSARQSEKYCLETEKMAENMATLNAIYAGMIAAMSNSRNQ